MTGHCAVDFVPDINTQLNVAETSVMAERWSVRPGAR